VNLLSKDILTEYEAGLEVDHGDPRDKVCNHVYDPYKIEVYLESFLVSTLTSLITS
jgi:hypothetical protein